jgi:hypothetical protein
LLSVFSQSIAYALDIYIYRPFSITF